MDAQIHAKGQTHKVCILELFNVELSFLSNMFFSDSRFGMFQIVKRTPGNASLQLDKNLS